MTVDDYHYLLTRPNVAKWRLRLAQWIESPGLQNTIITIILMNAIILGIQATPWNDQQHIQHILWIADTICLIIFIIELLLKGLAYRFAMFRNGWNIFDAIVIAIALIPASGPASVLRGLRVLRLFRLFSVVPSMRRVVLAFLHALPGLGSVGLLMCFFLYVTAVMATGFFGDSHPDWFGHVGLSLYTLFQVMTLESWSMGIARPLMETHPWAWAFFIPFLLFATFTILNLFIGIIVSTMQELGPSSNNSSIERETNIEILERIEKDIAILRESFNNNNS